jgi:hypothetical protein
VCRLSVTYCSKRVQIEVMKTEVLKYQALADSIKSSEERKDSKGKVYRRTLSTYLIGGSQTVQHYQHSRTFCVQC